MSFVVLVCWRCTQPGHGYTECQRPGAKTTQEHEARIADILRRWDAGRGGFGLTVKTAIVEMEKKAHEKARNAE